MKVTNIYITAFEILDLHVNPRDKGHNVVFWNYKGMTKNMAQLLIQYAVHL